MISVLVNAYACSPHWGSEPGMGWNWILALSKYCELYIITEGEWRDKIELAFLLLLSKMAGESVGASASDYAAISD